MPDSKWWMWTFVCRYAGGLLLWMSFRVSYPYFCCLIISASSNGGGTYDGWHRSYTCNLHYFSMLLMTYGIVLTLCFTAVAADYHSSWRTVSSHVSLLCMSDCCRAPHLLRRLFNLSLGYCCLSSEAWTPNSVASAHTSSFIFVLKDKMLKLGSTTSPLLPLKK